MIAPDGRLLSRRWRLAVAVPVAALALDGWRPSQRRPVPTRPARSRTAGFRETLAEVLSASFSSMLLSISLGAVALALRLRRSTGRQRLQLRWISTAAAILAVTFVLYALSESVNPQGTPWILPEATCLAYIFFSVSVGVAIFRYRLYDIDVILSRAIVLGVLAVFVTIGYIVVVVAIGAVLVAVGAPGSTLYWPSLLATALVAVAFQPVRQTRAPAGGSTGLRKPGRAVRGPGHAEPATRGQPITRRPAGQGRRGHRTRHRGRRRQRANRRSAGTIPGAQRDLVRHRHDLRIRCGSLCPQLVLPVLDMGEQVGSIEVTMPPGRALRTFERRPARGRRSAGRCRVPQRPAGGGADRTGRAGRGPIGRTVGVPTTTARCRGRGAGAAGRSDPAQRRPAPRRRRRRIDDRPEQRSVTCPANWNH